MATTRVVMNPKGLKELSASEGVRKEITAIAEPCLAKAKDNAEVLTGAYRDGLHIEQTTTSDGDVEVRIAGSTDHDIYVEARTGNLTRSLDEARTQR